MSKRVKMADLRPMSDHPEPGTVVDFYYTDRLGGKSHYVALWNGEKWMCKVPYKEDKWTEMPDYNFLGWCNPTSKEDRKFYKNKK